MRLIKKIIVTSQFILVFATNTFAQNYIEPIASYSFNANTIADESGNSQLFMRNNTVLYNDAKRGNVLRFSADYKSYAALNKNLFHSDSCTIAFFFFWESQNAQSWHQLFEIFDA